jgi:hypothetical protein
LNSAWLTIGTLAAGFAGGAIAWFATNFWGKPISKFPDLRLQAQEAILFHANIGPYLADTDRTPKASDDLRRIAAQIETAAKARYLIELFAATSEGQDSHRQKLIASVLEDLAKLSD